MLVVYIDDAHGQTEHNQFPTLYIMNDTSFSHESVSSLNKFGEHKKGYLLTSSFWFQEEEYWGWWCWECWIPPINLSTYILHFTKDIFTHAYIAGYEQHRLNIIIECSS